ILAPWAELPRGGCPRGKQAFWKSEPQLARRCVSIERGYQDALGCRAQQTEDEPVNDRDRAPNQEAYNPADRHAAKEKQEARQREQEKDRPEAEVSAHGLAPRLPKERAAPLDRGPRSDLLEDQDRDDEIRDDAPGRTRESRDDAQPLEETETPRSRGKRPESGRRRDGRRRRPHGDRAPIWSGLHQPTGGTPRSRKNDCVGSHVGATQMDLDSSQEKLLKKTANTRAPAAMKRSSRAW